MFPRNAIFAWFSSTISVASSFSRLFLRLPPFPSFRLGNLDLETVIGLVPEGGGGGRRRKKSVGRGSFGR